MMPLHSAGVFPAVERGSSREGLSIIENNSDAAEDAFVIACVVGMMRKTDVAPSVTLRTTVNTVPTLGISPL